MDNYSPNPSGTVDSDSYGNLGNLKGYGDPNGVVYGRAGWSYYDRSTDELYFNTGDGRNTTWTQFVAVGGNGAGLTYHQSGALDPNGSVVGTVGDVFHSRVSQGGDGSVWWKVSGTGNTGWE